MPLDMDLNYHFPKIIFRELVMNLGIGDFLVPLKLRKFLSKLGFKKFLVLEIQLSSLLLGKCLCFIVVYLRMRQKECKIEERRYRSRNHSL
jgi:hypothetical protein